MLSLTARILTTSGIQPVVADLKGYPDPHIAALASSLLSSWTGLVAAPASQTLARTQSEEKLEKVSKRIREMGEEEAKE